MGTYQDMVNKVIKKADIILLLLDSRFVQETRHPGIENKVRRENKPLIYVITKADLIDKSKIEMYKNILQPCVFVSAKEHQGKGVLRQAILAEAKKNHIEDPVVGVLGYPNVGKSSLINALNGHHTASTSSESGHTRSVQKIKMDGTITLLDTPGVIPFSDKDVMKHAVVGAIGFSKAKEPDLVVMELMQKFPGRIEAHYKVNMDDDEEQKILDIGKKFNLLGKGGEPDLLRASRMILKDWQAGKIN
jgi:ribosome biogenesis GTPase A